MASESEKAKQDRAEALRLFQSGSTKAEIARELGKDRKAVAGMIALALREKGNGSQG